ncbi:MAG: AbrB/MazE/SpoVT family DNA-binding domain-containing protein [Candidatus Micrarchaeia archaeon]|jgi:bifunctional DNA-binding transcriptional regulator/antitoxin component of YhaV-PrlF toxin-antitoxin module
MNVGITKMTRNGQLTLPLSIRQDAGIDEGAQLVVVQDDSGIRILTPNNLEDVFKAGSIIAKKENITRKELEKRIKEARRITYAEYKTR